MTALEVKDTPRRPDGVLLEPSPAVPPVEEHARATDGVVALRQPIADDQLVDLAREYVRVFTQHTGNIGDLLADDAVLYDQGAVRPRQNIVAFARDKYQTNSQDWHYAQQEDVVRGERLERWAFDDLGPHTDPSRPGEMRQNDVYMRVGLQIITGKVTGNPLFHNTLVLLVRRGGDRKLKIAGLQETDAP